METIPLPPELFPRTISVLQEAVDSEHIPGAIAGFWSAGHPEKAWIYSCGKRRLIPHPQPLTSDTVFDLASLTKLYTATLTAVLVERGTLEWTTKVKSIFPELTAGDGVEIRHLLSHTAGYAAWAPYWEKLRDHFGGSADSLVKASISERQKLMKKWVLSAEPEVPVGERALYSDISFLILGFLLEEVLQNTLDEEISHLIFPIAGMEQSGFRKVDRPLHLLRDESVAATEISDWRGGLVQGSVHDDNCWAMGGWSGHAGAFGTALDVLKFSAAMIEGKILSAAYLEEVWKKSDHPVGCSRTLGWDTPSGEFPSAGRFFPFDKTVGHLGYTGTSLWIDLKLGLAVTLLTNRVHPTRENQSIRQLRPRFHDELRMELTALR